MTTQIVGKQSAWSGNRDTEGYRTYKISFKIKADLTDGPANVMETPGLYLPGSPWIIDNDVDLWAWCKYDMDCKPLQQKDGEAVTYYLVEQTFSSKPYRKCNDAKVEDPILEPMKISGGFVKKTIEATIDRFGNPVVNSAWEQLRGGMVEFGKDTDTITIEQNVISLDLPLVQSMKNNVNKFPLWGMPPRTILFGDFKWEEKYYGLCYKYYTRKFTFEIKEDTWDQLVPDYGTKVLNGHWSIKPEEGPKNRWILNDIDGAPPNPLNPQHFIRFVDINDNPTKVLLDGFGQPYNPLLNSSVTACTKCPGGMPRYLEVQEPLDSIGQGIFQPQVLAYSSGCLWGNAGMSLEFDEDEDRWTLTDLDTGGLWHLSSADWSCSGDNEMILDEQFTFNEDFPVALNIVASVSIPGARLIQYYKETDFQLLGIPMVL